MQKSWLPYLGNGNRVTRGSRSNRRLVRVVKDDRTNDSSNADFVVCLKAAFNSGDLRFHDTLRQLADPRAFREWLRTPFRQDWVVYLGFNYRQQPMHSSSEVFMPTLGAGTINAKAPGHFVIATTFCRSPDPRRHPKIHSADKKTAPIHSSRNRAIIRLRVVSEHKTLGWQLFGGAPAN